MGDKKAKYQSTFLKSFTEIPYIASSSKGITYAKCTACCCDFSVAHGGKADVTKHIRTQKHIESVRCIEKNQKLTFSVNNSDQAVTNAECLFTSFLLEHNLPLSVSDHAAPLFKKMFPDSQIAKKYACARTKTTSIVKEIANQGKIDVIDILKKTPFAIATDGSNNSDSKIYPLIVSFFNSESFEIEYKLLSMPVLKIDSTGANIADLTLNKLKDDQIPMANCLALSADNAPVMVGIKNGVAANLKNEIPQLYVMGCLCHLINLAAQKGAACLPLIIDEYLVDIFYYLEKSCKRKEKLKKFQELHNTESRKILKHVCTRWLSLGQCLSRVIDQWTPLLSFFKDEVDDKLKIENCRIPKKKTLAATTVKEKKKTHKEKIKTHKEERKTDKEMRKTDKEMRKTDKEMRKTDKEERKTDKEERKTDKEERKTDKEERKADKEERKISSQTHTSNLKKKSQQKRKNEFESSQINKFSKGIDKQSKTLTREERLFMFLSSDLNKAFCLFLRNTLPLFDVPNTTLQTRIPLIHKLYCIISEMFKNILSKFVKPAVITSSDSIFHVEYNKTDHQKQDEDLVIGTATFKFVDELTETDKKTFFFHVRQYFCKICDYIVTKFPINDEVILHARVADISNIENASFSDVKYFLNRFPVMLEFKDSNFDDAMDKLETQFCSLQLEDLEDIKKKSERIDTQWSFIGNMKSLDGTFKYKELSKIMLSILTIPHSNAECERIFSFINKTRNKFRSNISDDMLEKLLISKMNIKGCCYEQKFESSFLKIMKSATTVNNLS